MSANTLPVGGGTTAFKRSGWEVLPHLPRLRAARLPLQGRRV